MHSELAAKDENCELSHSSWSHFRSLTFPSDQLFVARTKTAVQHGWHSFLFGRNNLTKTRELLKSMAVSTCPTLLQFWRQRKGRRESSYSCTQWGSTGARLVTWPMYYRLRPIKSVVSASKYFRWSLALVLLMLHHSRVRGLRWSRDQCLLADETHASEIFAIAYFSCI